jgi:hypothetical protein
MSGTVLFWKILQSVVRVRNHSHLGAVAPQPAADERADGERLHPPVEQPRRLVGVHDRPADRVADQVGRGDGLVGDEVEGERERAGELFPPVEPDEQCGVRPERGGQLQQAVGLRERHGVSS